MMGIPVNHHQITGERRAFQLYAKAKHQKGRFHPFKGTAKNSNIQKDVFNLEGENSQNNLIAEPYSTWLANLWNIQSPSEALGIRQ